MILCLNYDLENPFGFCNYISNDGSDSLDVTSKNGFQKNEPLDI